MKRSDNLQSVIKLKDIHKKINDIINSAYNENIDQGYILLLIDLLEQNWEQINQKSELRNIKAQSLDEVRKLCEEISISREQQSLKILEKAQQIYKIGKSK